MFGSWGMKKLPRDFNFEQLDGTSLIFTHGILSTPRKNSSPNMRRMVPVLTGNQLTKQKDFDDVPVRCYPPQNLT